MPQNTNLNVNPYFDDFDKNKKFNKVLFKPGTPVQARELTTLQSILQDQIEKFGQHMFKEGSIVIPGTTNYDDQYYAVKLESTFFGVPVESYFDKLVGLEIKGKSSGVTAVVKSVLKASKSTQNATTIYVKYRSAADDKTTQTFQDGENLVTLSDFTFGSTTTTAGSDFATCILKNATLTGSAFTVTEGVFFARGVFVQVETETIILDQYSNNPSYRVGFQVIEEIVTAVEDDSLYDNAAGFSNYTAPGADRFKISLRLTKKALDNFQDENFIELFRTNKGEIKEIVTRTVYNKIADELARRTFDESGDYYVTPFSFEAKESLNDRHSQFGVFFPEELTDNLNTPSKDIVSIKVGPGKAYVKGFEVETYGARFVDSKKPRETELVESSTVPFQAGNNIRINNVYGGASVGIATTGYVDLRSNRLGTDRDEPAGQSVGRARVYDFKLSAGGYSDATSSFDLFLWDIQTDTEITLNNTLSISAPALIEGKRSGARGFLRSQTGNILTLHQTAGKFVQDEAISVDGIDNGRIITKVTEFGINDIRSIRQEVGVQTFSGDTILEPRIQFGGQSFNFSATSGGKSTVTSTSNSWTVGIQTGDIIQYNSSGTKLNRVKTVSPTGTSVEVEAVADVSGVCSGSLPGAISVSGLSVVSPVIRNFERAFLYADMPDRNVESVDLTRSDIFVRDELRGRTINALGTLDLPTLSGTDFVYTPFDEERYTVLYEDGTIEPLSSDQFVVTGGGKGATLSGLSASKSNVVVHVTKQKVKVTAKDKDLKRCESITVTGSKYTYSGVSTSVGDGLGYSNAYGKRVQDREISLDTPDVVRVRAVFESSSNADPTVPSLTFTGLNGPNADNSDLIKGESVIGKVSGASALILGTTGTQSAFVKSSNEGNFIEGEEIYFTESKVGGKVSSATLGDKEISANFILDNGQRLEMFDFGRLVRRQGAPEPSRRIKVFFDKFVINSEDSGDFVTASSYDSDVYDLVPTFICRIDGLERRNTDAVDIRPRVADYSGSLSPFEWGSRIFSGSSVSTVLVSDENITFDYKRYLGRIDRLFLNSDSTFTLVEGQSSRSPERPEAIDSSFELAEITYAPYVFDVNRDITIETRSNKRYTMKDIGAIEKRIENVEFATSLSLLEAKTEALTVRDPETGLDSFKTGFAVDNFSTFALADTTIPQLKYDLANGTAVSRSYYDVIDLLIGSESLIGLSGVPNNAVDIRYADDLGSQNVTKKGSRVLLNYTEVLEFDQPFASRVENVNPYDVVTYQGNMFINPTEDVWIEREFNTRDGGFGVTEVITETESIPNLRSQNIAFTGYRLKPGTKFYSSFSRVDMSDQRSLTVPKLIEITPVKGAFQIGETVIGKLLNNQNTNVVPEIRFRVATPNHKDGPYNAPTLVYESSPYDGAGISSSYSDTSTLLNVDTGSLNQKSDERFFGNLVKDMRLVGQTSNAEAQVTDVRLISDQFGALLGSIHIPDGNPNFTNGSNTVGLRSVKGDSDAPIGAPPVSQAFANFFSRGEVITQTTINRVAPPPPPPPPVRRSRRRRGRRGGGGGNDPLAQSFFVTDVPGIFITSMDIFFFTKSNTVPVELSLVEIETGLPTDRIIESKILEPSQVKTSEDGSVPTNFQFDFPVYLTGGEYALVLKADTQEYQVWICRMGEDDIRTKNTPELGKIVINKQPTLGSLFKSQNASTWTPSQLEDIKYKAYKAKFTTDQGTFKLYNPELQTFNRRNLLPSNPIEVFDKKVTVGLSSDLKNPNIVVGTQIKQNNRTSSGFVEGTLGAVGAANTGFNITNAGIGYSNTTFGAVNFTSLTGNGSGATGIVTVSGGTVDSVCVLNTGSGYQVGDTVTATLGSNNLGRNLVLTVGVVTSTNALKLTGVTGQDFNTSDTVQYVSSGGSTETLASITPTSVTINGDEFDGKHIRVSHPNHGMHAFNNKVELTRIEGDTIPTNITVGYGASSIENISIASSANFNMFEGSQVSTTNPGFALIADEIIAYTGVGNNILTGITTRGVDGTTTQSFLPGTPIQKYELKGISLRNINTVHSFADVTNSIPDKIGLDHYYLKINSTNSFTSHSLGGGLNARASQNIQFESMVPNLKHILPDDTTINASARTTSGTSISGSETSFQDRGYEPVSISGRTDFANPRIIASRVNESDKLGVLPGSKSFTLDVTIGSSNENVSPVVDVFDSNITVRSNRVNAPITNYITDRRSNTLLEDPHTFSYVTSVIELENPASSLKVILAAFKPGTSEVRVLYRLRRSDQSDIDKVFELMPGFNNLDINGKVIDAKNNDGTSDRQISNSLEEFFYEHQFTANSLPQFSGYQVKVELISTNQAESPSVRDFRVIALA